MNDALREAAQWFVLLASGDAGEDARHRWLAWRAADPAHEAAWQRAGAALAPFARIPAAQMPLSAAVLTQAERGRATGRRRALVRFAGTFVVGAVGWQTWRTSDRSADLRTAVGEQREFALADGGHLLLDTDTVLDVAYSGQRRHLRLRRGRVLIATASDPRPFTVATAQGHVQALGTRFVVEQRLGSTQVSVLESRVAIHPDGQALRVDVLEAGEAASFGADGPLQRQVAPRGEPGWTRGMLAADDIALGDLVAELARYRGEPLACDPAAAALRISGHFPLKDSDRALAAIVATLPVRLERRTRFGTPGVWLRRR